MAGRKSVYFTILCNFIALISLAQAGENKVSFGKLVKSGATTKPVLDTRQTRSKADCGRACAGVAQCQAFSVDSTARQCTLYASRLTALDITPAPSPEQVQNFYVRRQGLFRTAFLETLGRQDLQGSMATGRPSGVYSLDIQDGLPAFQVFLDVDTDGGPWLVFQRRMDGSANFSRNWEDYTSGFGDLEKEFWLGLEKLNRLTSAGLRQLRVDMASWEGETGYALYSTFLVGSSSDYFRLEVHGYSGTAGDDMYCGGCTNTANRMWFSTYDQDNDLADYNCAQEFEAGWWYNDCNEAHPNGLYSLDGSWTEKMAEWPSLSPTGNQSLKFIEMKIK